MKNKLNMFVIVGMGVLLIVVVVVVALIQNTTYATKNKQLSDQVNTLTAQVNELTTAKDSNGFAPTDVTKAFINEVKSGNSEKAKLYLGASVQNMDTQATLKLGSDLANLTIGEATQEITDDTATVGVNVTVADTTTARQFSLTKVDNVWKITGVVAE